jgi:hypothetical protein
MFGRPVLLKNGNMGLPIDREERSRFIEVGTALRGRVITFEQYQAEMVGFVDLHEHKELLLDIALFYRLGHADVDFEQGFVYSDWDCAVSRRLAASL